LLGAARGDADPASEASVVGDQRLFRVFGRVEDEVGVVGGAEGGVAELL
jgi:hypothetical protein